jgi:hypothetical protein
MSIRVEDFRFERGEEPTADGVLEVTFRVPAGSSPVALLRALELHVGGSVEQAVERPPTLASVPVADVPPVETTTPARRARKPRPESEAPPAPPAPVVLKNQAGDVIGPEDEVPGPSPVVETTVIPPRSDAMKHVPVEAQAAINGLGKQLAKEGAAQAVQAPKANGSAPVAATASAASSPSAASVETPHELMSASSFRKALEFLVKQGNDTQEKLVAACRYYGAVPALARYLVPNADPELGIEQRIARFFVARGESGATAA